MDDRPTHGWDEARKMRGIRREALEYAISNERIVAAGTKVVLETAKVYADFINEGTVPSA